MKSTKSPISTFVARFLKDVKKENLAFMATVAKDTPPPISMDSLDAFIIDLRRKKQPKIKPIFSPIEEMVR